MHNWSHRDLLVWLFGPYLVHGTLGHALSPPRL